MSRAKRFVINFVTCLVIIIACIFVLALTLAQCHHVAQREFASRAKLCGGSQVW